jgi:hypothetical protein
MDREKHNTETRNPNRSEMTMNAINIDAMIRTESGILENSAQALEPCTASDIGIGLMTRGDAVPINSNGPRMELRGWGNRDGEAYELAVNAGTVIVCAADVERAKRAFND